MEKLARSTWCCSALTFLALILLPMPLYAQGGWSVTERIPGYHSLTLPPILVADQNGTVHAFSSQPLRPEDGGRYMAIMYNQWTLEGGWTKPIDIILPQFQTQANVMGAFLADDGMMHVVFFSGDDLGAHIYYAKAPAVLAGQARAWSTPIIIGPNARTPRIASLAADHQGNFVVTYSGIGDGSGLYAVHSSDGGKSWSETIPILLTYDDGLKPFDLASYMGESGYAHVVWNVTNELGRNISGHYARLNLGTGQWDDPILLAPNAGLGVAIPSVIEHNSTIYVIFNNGLGEEVAPIHWIRTSTDLGVTWSNPYRPFPQHIGRNGVISFVVDGDDILHVFFGQRIPSGFQHGETKLDLHGMWHSVLRNNSWSAPEAVVSGPPKAPDSPRDTGFDPYDARAVVSQGNVILVTWRTDPGASRDGVWYSYASLSSAELPIVSLPIPTATPTIISSPTPEPYTPTPQATFEFQEEEISGISLLSFSNNPAAPIVAGVIPTVLIVGLLLLVNRRRY